jgi:hypothetical protein
LPTNWTTFTTLTGLTREVVGTGTESGITYIDIRLSGTPSAAGSYFINFETTTQVAASSGQAWTSSAYYKLQSGSLTGVTAVSNAVSARSAVGADLSSITTAFTPTAAALNTQRVTSTITSNPASTAFETQFVRLDLSGVAIDITLRIGLPQLELGAFATSVIPTTTTALTRAADVASVNTLSPWYNATEGTLFAEFTRGYTGNFINFSSAAVITNNAIPPSTNGIASAYTNGANQQLYNTMTLNSVEQLDYRAKNSQITNKVALAYKTNDTQQFINGLAEITDTSCTVPTSVSQMNIGASYVNNTFINSWIRRVTYYPRRLSQAEGIAITA